MNDFSEEYDGVRKRKKKSKKHKKHKKSKHNSDSSEDEWVEKSSIKELKMNASHSTRISSNDDSKASHSQHYLQKEIGPIDLFASNKSEDNNKQYSRFKKPQNDDSFTYERKHASISSRSSNWRKRSPASEKISKYLESSDSSENKNLHTSEDHSGSKASSSSKSSDDYSEPKALSNSKSSEDTESHKTLSNQEMNDLAAKIMKAEIMGNVELVNELKTKLNAAQKSREENPERHTDVEKMPTNVATQSRLTFSRSMVNCSLCIDSEKTLKGLIIEMKNDVYLSLPPFESLTEGHCIITTTQHLNSSTQIDESAWKEVQSLRKALTKMFLSRGEDVIFLETAMNFKRDLHMLIHCIPIPEDVGTSAPIYFKKAILECEYEWADNKKVVDLKGRNVRKAIPKELPYFSVEFGMDSGFAHVIENQSSFPEHFGQEIIGGMLDLDHRLWRKSTNQNCDVQSLLNKVDALKEMWNEAQSG